MPDINVTTEGIRKLLQKLNVNKASGTDMIPARILKDLSEEIAPFVCTIYQKCLETSQSLLSEKQQMSRQSSRKVRSLKLVILGLSPLPASAARCLNTLS